MAETLRIHPVWETASRPLAPSAEPAPETTLRREIARVLEIDPRAVFAVDREGREVDLEGLPEGDALAVSAIPFLRPESRIVAGSFRAIAQEAKAGDADPAPEPVDLDRLAPAERELAAGLAGLGVHLGAVPSHLDELVEAFPDLPPGYGLRSRSPYRFFFATTHFLEERRTGEFEELEAAVDRMFASLSGKLRLVGGDDLDVRLYLLASHEDADRRALEGYLSRGPRPAAPGRRHRGWRRVVAVPYADETDRLGKIARIGQQIALERAEPTLRHRLQRACGAFAPVYSEEGWVDHQAQVLLRPAEERLHSIARKRLVARLVHALDGAPLVETESARGLARRLIARSGLLDGRFEEDGPRLDDLARTWSDPDPLPHRPPGEPHRDAPEGMRPWLHALANGALPEPVADDRASLAARTAAVVGACRLREAIESLLEREVFPRFGNAELDFGRLVAALSTLAGEIQAIGVDDGESGRIDTWLGARRALWEAESERCRGSVLRAAEPLDLWWHRILEAFGIAPRRISERLDDAARGYVDARARAAVASALSELAHDGELARIFGGVLEIVGRLEALAPAGRALAAVLDRESRSRERLLALQTDGLEGAVPEAIRERLFRAVDRIDLAPALGEALRCAPGAEDLMRLAPDAVVERAWAALADALEEPIEHLAQETDLPLLGDVVESGLRKLFGGAAVPHAGPDGRIGALDGRTHLLAIASPELLARGGDDDLVKLLRRHLPALGVRRDLPIEVTSSPGIPGLFLIRCVHGLAPREVLP